MRILQGFDRFVGKHILGVTVVCMASGVLFGDYLGFLAVVTRYFFAFMTLASCMGAGFGQMREVARRPAPVLLTLALIHVVEPLAGLAAGRLFFPDEPLFIIGVILAYAVPTAIFSLFWTSLVRGNMPLSLSIVLISTICSPVVIPLTLKLLAGEMTEIDSWGIMKDLVFMVAIPAVAAMCVQRFAGDAAAQTWKVRLSPFSKVCMLVIMLSNSSNVSPFVRNMTPLLWKIMAVMLLLSVLGFALSWLLARLLRVDFSSTLSIVLTGGMRNISAGAVLAARYFPDEVMYPVMISCLFLQVLVSLVVKLLRRTPAGRAELAAYEASLSPEEAAAEAGV